MLLVVRRGPDGHGRGSSRPSASPPVQILVTAGGPGRLVDRRAFGTAAGQVRSPPGRCRGGPHAAGRIRRRRGPRRAPPSPRRRPRPRCQTAASTGFVTANRDFYRVDTALTVPRVDVAGWRLKIEGMVGPPARTVLRRPARPPADRAGHHAQLRLQRGRRPIRRHRPLAWCPAGAICCARPGGGPGGPVGRALRRRHDDRHAAGGGARRPRRAPLRRHERRTAAAGARFPRPHAHPRPLRLRRRLQVGHRARADHVRRVDAYWVQRGWAAAGPVKTASRIDRPPRSRTPPPAPSPVAGVAWAQGRGIAGRGAGRRRAVAAGDACCRAVGRHLGAVALLTGPPRPAAHRWRSGPRTAPAPCRPATA